MKKILILTTFIFSFLFAPSQTIWNYDNNTIENPFDISLRVSPDLITYYPVYRFCDTSTFECYTDSFIVWRWRTDTYNDGRPTSVVWATPDGQSRVSPVDSLPFLTAADTVSLSNRIDAATPTVTINNGVSRSLSNSTGSTNRYTISTSKNARVNYSITINWSVTALLTSSGTVYLEYSTDSGTSWTTVSQVTSSVSLGLTLSGSNDMNLSGEIPANALVRLRTTTTNATCTYVRGQEVLY